MPRILTVRLFRGLLWVAFTLDDFGGTAHKSYGTTAGMARFRCLDRIERA